jgi:lysyl-tRNA synthetase class 2
MHFRQTAIENNLRVRAAVIQELRRFFIHNGYLEIETPLRIPAPAPEAHIHAQPAGQWFLQTSPELCMKQMLAAGYDRIFQVCRCFRQHERGDRHIPEMTLLEWYTAGEDYRHMMDQTEHLIRAVVGGIDKRASISHRGRHIELGRAWRRMTVAEAFDRYAPIALDAALDDDRFDEVMGLEIEPRLGLTQPVFLYDYPVRCGALARLKAGDPCWAERFELYIGGLELCNGFSELTDPVEQRRRFEQEQQRRRHAGEPVYPMPETFLRALEYMPEATGNALGVDRLVMLLADARQIDDIVAFTPEEL